MAVLDLVRVEDPADLLPLDVAKAYLRVDSDDEDDEITDMVRGVVGLLDGYDGRLGRAIVTQTWALYLPCFPARRRLRLPLPPLQSVTSIVFRDPDGAEQTVDPADYIVLNGPMNAVEWRTGFAVPATEAHPRAVTITFVAGYGDVADAPKAIVRAAKLLLGWAYENREGEAPEPAAVTRLLSGYRVPKI